MEKGVVKKAEKVPTSFMDGSKLCAPGKMKILHIFRTVVCFFRNCVFLEMKKIAIFAGSFQIVSILGFSIILSVEIFAII